MYAHGRKRGVVAKPPPLTNINISHVNRQAPRKGYVPPGQPKYGPKSTVAPTPLLDKTSFAGLAKLAGSERFEAIKEILEDQFSRLLADGGEVFVVGETGSGKSTQATRALHHLGFKVYHTVPRRKLTESLAKFISELDGYTLGGEVGFGHGLAEAITKKTRHIIETHGRLVIRGLDALNDPDSVLVIDEVHEPNELKETLVAEAIEMRNKGQLKNLVLMSATPNLTALRAAFPAAATVEVPSNPHNVEFRERDTDMRADIVSALKNGDGCLVFCEGKNEVESMVKTLSELYPDAEYIPWHSKQSMQDQEKVFASYDRPKCVIATNIAEAGITIPGVVQVFSNKWTKRLVVVDGAPTLAIVPKALATVCQEMGRVGRLLHGIYNWYGGDLSELPKHPPPQIQCIELDTLALQILARDKRIERLPYPELPPQIAIDRAYQSLEELNLMGPRGHITMLGERVAALPVNVNLGVMLAKAERFADSHPAVLRAAIDIAAILESEGIVKSKPTTQSSKRRHERPHDVAIPKAKRKAGWKQRTDSKKPPGRSAREKANRWLRLSGLEQDSDALAYLRVFRAALALPPSSYEKHGVDRVQMEQALTKRKVLLERFDLLDNPDAATHLDHRETSLLLDCLYHGFANQLSVLVKQGSKGTLYYKHTRCNGLRKLSGDSALAMDEHTSKHKLVLGLPFNVESRSGSEIKTTRLLLFPTIVPPRWFRDHASPALKRRLRSTLQRPQDSTKKTASFAHKKRPQHPRGKGFH